MLYKGAVKQQDEDTHTRPGRVLGAGPTLAVKLGLEEDQMQGFLLLWSWDWHVAIFTNLEVLPTPKFRDAFWIA